MYKCCILQGFIRLDMSEYQEKHEVRNTVFPLHINTTFSKDFKARDYGYKTFDNGIQIKE